MSRENNIQYIIKNVKIMSDDTVTEIYDTVWKLCEDVGEKKLSRVQKIKYIITEIELVSDADLLKIERTIDNAIKYTKMYNALLNLLNKILEHNEMEQISHITKFKNIPRDLMINDECSQIVLDNFDELINSGFEKKTEGFTSNTNLVHANLNILRRVCTQLGYTLSAIKKSKMIKGERTFTTYYFIEKNI